MKPRLTFLISLAPPMHKSFQKFYGFDLQRANQATDYFREHYMIDGINQNTLYKDIPELLHKLNKGGKKLYIVSSKSKDQVQQILLAHNLETLFEDVIASKPGFPDTEKKIPIQDALALNPDLPKETYVMVGDRNFDIFGANDNNIDSIGVLYGFGGIEEITAAKPKYIAKSVEELEEYLL